MDLAVISIDSYKSSIPHDPDSATEEARKLAEALILTGAVVVRDSRATKETNDRFLDLLEDYFAQPDRSLKQDERPEVGYQVGVTLENTEKPKCSSDDECLAVISQLEKEQRPLDVTGHGADPKCRFFHRMSDRPPYQSAFPISEAPNVTPAAFGAEWEERVEEWGKVMKLSVEDVARMLAVGLGLPEDSLTSAGRYGSHLLAPTATNLTKWGKLDTIFAGFHTDLNFLTIHGQSRYPGLHIWARNSGKRIEVKIPPGCLLVQAGKQLEWMTGGLIKAGYHEVVCNERTLAAMKQRKETYPDRPQIRISSTFFWHLSPDHQLAADSQLRKAAEDRFGKQKEYGEMPVGEQVRRELGLIALMSAA